MRRSLQVNRSRAASRGTALAVAMLVIVMLSAIGIIAVNAASYDVASAGAAATAFDANSIASGGVALARCTMCENIDGIVIALQSMRAVTGSAPEFELDNTVLEAGLDAPSAYQPPTATERGSFGNLDQSSVIEPPPHFTVRIDRPRESGEVAGFSLRESAGSDTAAFCFRSYRLTSTGTYIPPGTTAAHGTTATSQAYIVAGPLECSN